METGTNHIIDLERLKGGVAAMLCRPCVEATLESLEDDTILEFKFFLQTKGPYHLQLFSNHTKEQR